MMLATLSLARPRVSVDRTAPFLWYTLCVRSQAQKWVCERAKELEIETYVPIKREPPAPSVVRKLRTTEPVERPLMPGYVFVALATAAPRFDLFQPFDRECDHPTPLPPDARAGYVADYAQPGLEPIWGCRGFLSGPDGPMPVHEAVIADMRLRERNGEFDLTGLTDDGRHRVAKWIKRAIVENLAVQCVGGPFAHFFGRVVKIKKPTLVTVEVGVFGRYSVVDMPVEWVRLVA